ncbi:MAG: hypothetical protein RLZZ127_1405 [Planctomycetota bacterium]|jgi:membrane-associated protease RseP (regulator of RpoE activity)
MRALPLLILPACLAAAAVDTDYEPAPNPNPQPQVQDPTAPPMLGIEMSPPPGRVLEREGLAPDQGVLVREVFPGSAAAEMGVQPGDVIIGVSGSPISSMTSLRNEVGSHQPGDGVQVEVSRNGARMRLNGTLREWPNHIPWEPIDAAAEANFRELQRRRAERQAKEVDQVAKDLAGLEQRLAQGSPARQRAARDLASVVPAAAGDRDLAAALAAPAAEALRRLPAWRIAWAARADDVPAAPAVPSAPAVPAAPAAGGPAWTFAWSLSL